MRIFIPVFTAITLMSGVASANDLSGGQSTGGVFGLRGGASFSGVQVGVTGGYSKMNDEVIQIPAFTAKGEGGRYGIFAAYLHQHGNVVAGVEVNYDRHDNMFDDGSKIVLEDMFTAKLRGGFAIGRVHAYGLAGVSNARTNTVGNGTGITFGAGIDTLVTDNIVFGAQYNYHYYGNFNKLKPFGINAEMHDFAGRIAYKF